MRNLARKVGCAFAGVMLAVTALTFGATSAANAAWSQCSPGYVCIWEHSGYSGAFWQWSQGSIVYMPGRCLNLPSWANNEASSIGNQGGRSARFQYDACGGSTYGVTLAPGQGTSFSYQDGKNDRISSIVVS